MSYRLASLKRFVNRVKTKESVVVGVYAFSPFPTSEIRVY